MHYTTFAPTTGHMDVTMQNVVVGNNSSATSASTTGHGIFFDLISGALVKAKLTGNNVQGALDSALTFQAGTSAGRLDGPSRATR